MKGVGPISATNVILLLVVLTGVGLLDTFYRLVVGTLDVGTAVLGRLRIVTGIAILFLDRFGSRVVVEIGPTALDIY